METVRLESKVRNYGTLNEAPLFHGKIGYIGLKERFKQNVDIPTTDYIGDYWLEVEFQSENIDELDDKNEEAKHLMSLLDKLWVYVTGYPLQVTDFSRLNFYIPRPTSRFWISNYQDVRKKYLTDTNTMGDGLVMSGGSSWLVFDQFPLKKACAAIERYRKLDEATTFLIDLHHTFLVSHPENREYFLLGKALEIVESMAMGRDRKEKSKIIHEELNKRAEYTLDDLLKISNTNRDIRHVIRNKKSPLQLHPKLTETEKSEFAKSANTIIRYVICTKLDLPFGIVQRA